jgi:hypothetical protein
VQQGATHRHHLLVLHALNEQPLPLLVLPLLHLQVQRLLVPAAAQHIAPLLQLMLSHASLTCHSQCLQQHRCMV